MQNVNQLPKIAIQSIAGGLFLMALFTIMWSGIASSGLQGSGRFIELGIFSLFSFFFIYSGIRVFIVSKGFPLLSDPEYKEEAKKVALRYGIIFGLEGIIIPIASGLLSYFKHMAYILPVIALIVGLHFYPMERIFQRTIDYWPATRTTLAALAAILAIHYRWLDPGTELAFLGICVAIATSCYGFYIAREGARHYNDFCGTSRQ